MTSLSEASDFDRQAIKIDRWNCAFRADRSNRGGAFPGRTMRFYPSDNLCLWCLKKFKHCAKPRSGLRHGFPEWRCLSPTARGTMGEDGRLGGEKTGLGWERLGWEKTGDASQDGHGCEDIA